MIVSNLNVKKKKKKKKRVYSRPTPHTRSLACFHPTEWTVIPFPSPSLIPPFLPSAFDCIQQESGPSTSSSVPVTCRQAPRASFWSYPWPLPIWSLYHIEDETGSIRVSAQVCPLHELHLVRSHYTFPFSPPCRTHGICWFRIIVRAQCALVLLSSFLSFGTAFGF